MGLFDLFGKKKKAPKSGKPKSKAKKTSGKKAHTKNAKGNTSKRYPNGRTLETADKYLPIIARKSKDPKEERRIIIIDSNRRDELAVVRFSTKNQPNTTALPTYKKGNKKASYFRHFVEIQDNEGNAIKVDGKRFKENSRRDDLTPDELKKVKNTVLYHVKQSQTNREAIQKLKDGRK